MTRIRYAFQIFRNEVGNAPILQDRHRAYAVEKGRASDIAHIFLDNCVY